MLNFSSVFNFDVLSVLGLIEYTAVLMNKNACSDICFCSSGRKVATVNSVILPPQKLKLNYDFQEWVQRETNEVQEK